MKVRLGFVSNSSTTSFVIYGSWIDEDKLIGKLKDNGIVEENEDNPDPYEILEKIGITCELTPYDQYCIGFDFDKIPDDAVVGEWKKEKAEVLKKMFGNDVECSLHVEGYNDNF